MKIHIPELELIKTKKKLKLTGGKLNKNFTIINDYDDDIKFTDINKLNNTTKNVYQKYIFMINNNESFYNNIIDKNIKKFIYSLAHSISKNKKVIVINSDIVKLIYNQTFGNIDIIGILIDSWILDTDLIILDKIKNTFGLNEILIKKIMKYVLKESKSCLFLSNNDIKQYLENIKN